MADTKGKAPTEIERAARQAAALRVGVVHGAEKRHEHGAQQGLPQFPALLHPGSNDTTAERGGAARWLTAASG